MLISSIQALIATLIKTLVRPKYLCAASCPVWLLEAFDCGVKLHVPTCLSRNLQSGVWLRSLSKVFYAVSPASYDVGSGVG